MTSMKALGAAIIVLWLAGLGMLARREMFVGEPEQMTEAALLVVPGTAYYEVMNGDERVGWASSSIDTSQAGISMRDVLVIDPPDSGARDRLAARARVALTPGLRLTSFTYELGGDHAPYRVSGKVGQDTMLRLVTSAAKKHPDTASVAVHRAVFWPTTVPLALALNARPVVGRVYKYSIFDPVTGAPEDIQLTVGAESLFVDSGQREAGRGAQHVGRRARGHGARMAARSAGHDAPQRLDRPARARDRVGADGHVHVEAHGVRAVIPELDARGEAVRRREESATHSDHPLIP